VKHLTVAQGLAQKAASDLAVSVPELGKPTL
jgi:hypothetical protein